MIRWSCFAIFVILAFYSPATFAAQFIKFSDFGPSAISSRIYDVSDDGTSVVGWYDTLNDGNDGFRAFHWRIGGTFTTLLRPDSSPVIPSDFQYLSISADGSKILGTDDGRPYLWTEGSGINYMDFLPNFPIDMSADASVIVGYTDTDKKGYSWSQANGLTIFDAFASAAGTYVEAVSADGLVVVGGAGGLPNENHNIAFHWTQNGGAVGMGKLGTEGSQAIEASADASAIVGSSAVLLGHNQAFRWTQDTGLVSLGDLPGGGMGSTATDITPDGQLAVGKSVVASSPQRSDPYVWDDVLGIRNLRTLLVDAGIPSPDWELNEAWSISADGTVIVGSGFTAVGDSPPQQGWIMLFERSELDRPLGDYNRDLVVDAADYVLWRKQLGNTVPACTGADANCDTLVSLDEYDPWRMNFGLALAIGDEASGSGANATIPEPSAFAISLLGFASIVLLGRNKVF